VLDLVRRGLTNAQIGERLYISPKTAGHHVGSVLGKLDMHSRAEAASLSCAGSSTIGTTRRSRWSRPGGMRPPPKVCALGQDLRSRAQPAD
jgi:hypothetical protein